MWSPFYLLLCKEGHWIIQANEKSRYVALRKRRFLQQNRCHLAQQEFKGDGIILLDVRTAQDSCQGCVESKIQLL